MVVAQRVQSQSGMHLRLVMLGFAALLACAPCARAQDLTDEDLDGVPDEVDECLDTPVGDFIDALGCSVCDCEATAAGDSWASRQAYFRCVLAEGKARKEAGRLTSKELRAVLKRARASSCGDEDLTRCCVWKAENGEGRCRVMAWDKCDYEILHAYDAVDWDVGSCLPDPCNEDE
jgi:hypothetical protein